MSTPVFHIPHTALGAYNYCRPHHVGQIYSLSANLLSLSEITISMDMFGCFMFPLPKTRLLAMGNAYGTTLPNSEEAAMPHN